jgi:hypothetical protein
MIFVIRFTFHVLRLTRNDLRMLADFFSILLETIMKGPWPVKVGRVNSR